jgi:F-type H+-transporting ATPase subunit alpha
MKFRTDEIVSVIREEISRYRAELDVADVGRVIEVGDGIAQIYGLSEAMAGEMLSFDNGQTGQVFNLESNSIGAVVYGSCTDIREGSTVRGTGKLLDVPVGGAVLGRVMDPLGRALDGKGDIAFDATRPVENPAPGIADRQPVDEPLHTGIKAVDAMMPIGRGQRELIIGDRKTGKTTLAVDAIISQAGSDVVCVYVAIGQKESSVAAIVDTLNRFGAMPNTVVVSASSSDSAALQYVAPYCGCAVAEHFMAAGRDTLVVYDDLSKHAAAYRQISLLLRRPPGREAYPGDVFYLHSRLLERGCKLAERYAIAAKNTPEDAADVASIDGRQYVGPLGLVEAEKALAGMPDAGGLKVHRLADSGGSMTCLPICETQEGEVSAYIPTNLIGITDGQVYLEPALFHAGVRPAINVGISVSRVGYKAATDAMKQVAKSLRLDLAAYRELESFAQLGMELNETSQRQLDRGRRMIRLLTQPQHAPKSQTDEVIAIYAGTAGFLDDLPVEEVDAFEEGLLKHVEADHPDFMAELRSDMALPADRAKKLRQIVRTYAEEVYRKQRKALLAAEGGREPGAARKTD